MIKYPLLTSNATKHVCGAQLHMLGKLPYRKKKSKESQCKYTLNLYIRHFYNDFLKDGRLLWNVDSTVV